MKKQYICEKCNIVMEFISSRYDGWGQIKHTYKCPQCLNEDATYTDDPNGPQHQPGFKGWR